MEAAASCSGTSAAATPPAASPLQAGAQSGMRDMFLGLVLGAIWGVWEEKKFVLRNCLKEYHLRECPTRLFSIMHRSVTTAPVVATFLGVHAGLRCWWHGRQLPEQQQQHQVQQQEAAQQAGHAEEQTGCSLHHPVLAGAAGTAAGAVRALLAEAAATVHPLVHAQRTVGAGAAAAGLFALGGYLDQEKQRQEQAAERQRVWAEEQWGGGG